MAERRAVVYSRSDCHLCEVAIGLLRQYRFQVETIKIDDDPQLIAQHGDWVPVVVIEGQVRFRGRVDEILLRRILRAPPKAYFAESAGPDRDERSVGRSLAQWWNRVAAWISSACSQNIGRRDS